MEQLLLRLSKFKNNFYKKHFYKTDFQRPSSHFRLIGFDQDSAGEDDDSRDGFEHGLIKYIDTKAKCRQLKK
jgi:hypothetical protein